MDIVLWRFFGRLCFEEALGIFSCYFRYDERDSVGVLKIGDVMIALFSGGLWASLG